MIGIIPLQLDSMHYADIIKKMAGNCSDDQYALSFEEMEYGNLPPEALHLMKAARESAVINHQLDDIDDYSCRSLTLPPTDRLHSDTGWKEVLGSSAASVCRYISDAPVTFFCLGFYNNGLDNCGPSGYDVFFEKWQEDADIRIAGKVQISSLASEDNTNDKPKKNVLLINLLCQFMGHLDSEISRTYG